VGSMATSKYWEVLTFSAAAFLLLRTGRASRKNVNVYGPFFIFSESNHRTADESVKVSPFL